MAVDTHVPAGVADYVGQTRRRMTGVTQEINNLRQGQEKDLHGLIIRLCEQERASQEAEFAGIVRLVHDMSDCLRWAARVQRPMAAGTLDALLDACQCILLHAEAVEAGVYPINRPRATPHQTGTHGQTREPLQGEAGDLGFGHGSELANQ